MERIPKTRRMRIRKVKAMNREKMSVYGDDDFRDGRREYRDFAIVVEFFRSTRSEKIQQLELNI